MSLLFITPIFMKKYPIIIDIITRARLLMPIIVATLYVPIPKNASSIKSPKAELKAKIFNQKRSKIILAGFL
jgi:hypothetical protein